MGAILPPLGTRWKCLQTFLLSQLGGWVLQAIYYQTYHNAQQSPHEKESPADVEKPDTEGQGRGDGGTQH